MFMIQAKNRFDHNRWTDVNGPFGDQTRADHLQVVLSQESPRATLRIINTETGNQVGPIIGGR